MKRALLFSAIAACCMLPLACRQVLGITEITVDSGADAPFVDSPSPPNPNPPPPPPPILEAGADADEEAGFDGGHSACIQDCVKNAGTATAKDYFEGPTDGTYICLCEPGECDTDCDSYCADKDAGRDKACTNCAVNDLNNAASMCSGSRCQTADCQKLNDCFLACPPP